MPASFIPAGIALGAGIVNSLFGSDKPRAQFATPRLDQFRLPGFEEREAQILSLMEQFGNRQAPQVQERGIGPGVMPGTMGGFGGAFGGQQFATPRLQVFAPQAPMTRGDIVSSLGSGRGSSLGGAYRSLGRDPEALAKQLEQDEKRRKALDKLVEKQNG